MTCTRFLRPVPCLALLCLALRWSGTTGAQTSPRVERTHHPGFTPTSTGTFATSVLGLGDSNGGGADDYLLADPFDQGGVVRVFAGENGALLWSRTGTGGTCPDRFGTAVARVPDVNFDGAEDVAVGSPNAGCGVGRFEILSGKTGATLFTETAFAGGRGRAVARLPDLDGDSKPEYLMQNTAGTVLYRGGTTSVAQVDVVTFVSPDMLLLSSAGDFNGDGFPGEVVLGDTTPGTVQVFDLASRSIVRTVTAGGLGSAAAFLENPGSPSTLLLGASTQSRVFRVDANGNLAVFAIGTNFLGESIATDGDVDNDGAEDVLISDRSQIQIRSRQGALFQVHPVPPNFVLSVRVAYVGNAAWNDGYDDFLVGVTTPGIFSSGPGFADLLRGGPTADVNGAFGPGFYAGTPAHSPPNLVLNSALRPGGSFTLSVGNTLPSVNGFLFIGVPDANGTPLPTGSGATAWLDLTTIQTLAFFTTTVTGAFTSAASSVPSAPGLLGLEWGFQAWVLQGGTDATSNAVSATIGW